MEPFDRYPGGGAELLGRRRGDNARHGYGLRLQRVTGISACAYCGVDLSARYHDWLTLQVDHVVPAGVARSLGIPVEYYEDMVNLVLSCSACNGFDNRYVSTGAARGIWDLPSFVEFRDQVFIERSARIRACHQRERAFFDTSPWQVS